MTNLAPHFRPCRDWYMNGNYLVILVSVVIILPLALMRQLGERGGARAWGLGQAWEDPSNSHVASCTLQATWATPAASPSAA